MKKIICLLCLTLLFLSSCSSSDTTSTHSAAEDDALVKEVWNDTDPGLAPDHIHFTYDGKKIVSASHPYEDRYYTYTGNLITKIQTYGNGNGLGYGLRMDELFTYDTNGRLTEHIFKSMPDGITTDYTITTTFVYNSGNTVSTTKMIGYPALGINQIAEIKRLHLSGGRVISEDGYTTSGAYVCTTHYNYDSKNNPFKNVIGYNEISLAEEWVFDFDHLRHLHNIVATHQTPSTGSTTSATYTYNSLNFPLIGVESYSSEPSFHKTIHYLYY